MARALVLCGLGGAVFGSAPDEGFESLFEDVLGDIYPEQCQDVHGLPSSFDGTYVVQSASQFSMGGRAFHSWLDAYWRVHAVTLSAGKACYKSKMIRSGFYNSSLAKGTVAGQVLFLETTPARECLLPGGMCNIMGANDNNFAVSYRMPDAEGGYRYALMTDTDVHLDFDLDTLDVIGKRKFDDHFALPLHMLQGGGTHLNCEAGKGSSAESCEGDLFGLVQENGINFAVDVYRLRQGVPDTRELVAHIPVPYSPGSLHSFAITKEFAVLPYAPFSINGLDVAEGKSIMDAIHDTGDTTPIYLVNLNDGSVKTVTFPGKIFYVHIVNSWQNATHITFDASAFEKQSFSYDDPAMILDVLRNKTARDTYNNTQTVRRYTIDLETSETTERHLTEGPSMIDFPKVNPKHQGLEYCIYYGVEWKHNGRDYGSWALRKHNVCTDEVKFFYEPSTYVAEGVFVPDGGSNEDDGYLLTTRTHGTTGVSDFVIIDARTMERVSSMPLPQRVGWYGHGAYFPSAEKVVV